MNDINQHIGIAVSGCKNGYAILALSGALNAADPAVKSALRDMRTYMRISEPKRDFYTMSFTPTCRVYTAARSSVDSVGSSGAYIAVSLFIPFDIAVRDAVALLDKMLTTYWEQHMHAMFSQPLSGKSEDIRPLQAILDANDDAFRRAALLYEGRPSPATALPVYVAFNSDEEVEAIFANPFRRQYFEAGMVIMLPEPLFSSDKVSFSTEVRRIVPSHTTPMQPLGMLHLPQGAVFQVRQFSADGRLLTNIDAYSLLPETRLTFTLGLPSGKTFTTFNGTVQQALTERRLTRTGTGYTLVPPEVTVSAQINGLVSGSQMTLAVRDRQGKLLSSGTVSAISPVLTCRVPAVGFPLSIYVKEGQNERPLRRDAFTEADIEAAPIVIELPRAAEGKTPPPLSPTPQKPTERSSRTSRIIWILSAGIVACLVAIVIILYMWLWSGDAEETTPPEPTPPPVAAVIPDTTVLKVSPNLLPPRWNSVQIKGHRDTLAYRPWRPSQPLYILLPNSDTTLHITPLTELVFNPGHAAHFTLSEVCQNIDSLLTFPRNTVAVFTLKAPTQPAQLAPDTRADSTRHK